MDILVTFRVGQVWENKLDHPGYKFTITSISDGAVFARKGKDQRSNVFTYLKKGTTSYISELWECLEDPGNKNDWRAWQNKRPGECVCGMMKSLCVYHK